MQKLRNQTEPQGQSYLAIDNDGAVDVGAEDGLAQGVEVTLQGGGGVADRDAVVGEAGELLLQLLDDVMKGDQFLDLDLGFLLGDVSDLDLTTVLLGALLENLDELGLLGFDTGACDIIDCTLSSDSQIHTGTTTTETSLRSGEKNCKKTQKENCWGCFSRRAKRDFSEFFRISVLTKVLLFDTFTRGRQRQTIFCFT